MAGSTIFWLFLQLWGGMSAAMRMQVQTNEHCRHVYNSVGVCIKRLEGSSAHVEKTPSNSAGD